MSDNGRVAILFGFNVILMFLIGELNHVLSGYSLRLHLDVLLVLFFGLYLGIWPGLLYAALFGLLADARSPAGNGFFFIAYLLCWLFFVFGQRRIRRQSSAHVRWIAVLAQAAWLATLSLLMGDDLLTSGAYWIRVLTDTALSLALLYAIAWPWCRFQHQMLYSLGWDLEAQPPRL